jgi:hypothetical protein
LGFPTGWSFTTHKDCCWGTKKKSPSSTSHQGVRVHPSPLYKGGALGRGGHNNSTNPSSDSHLPPTPGAPASLGRRLPPLSLPCGLSKGCVGDKNHHRDTPSCCGVSGFRPKPSTSASRLETGFQELSWSPYVCEYMEVPLVWCRSRCSKIFMTLRLATSSSSSTLVWECNPRVLAFEGTCPKLLPLQHY